MRRLALAAFFAATLSASAPAAEAQVAGRLDDLRLATAVRLALVDDPRTRLLDVAVAAERGEVRVEGEVPPAERRTALEVARAVPGVRMVVGLGSIGDAPATPAVVLERPGPPRPTPPAETAPQAPAPDGPVYHEVRPGDTLFSIARRYGTTVEEVLRLNGRPSSAIRVGERLRVR